MPMRRTIPSAFLCSPLLPHRDVPFPCSLIDDGPHEGGGGRLARPSPTAGRGEDPLVLPLLLALRLPLGAEEGRGQLARRMEA
jgi:hypothetical protein